MDWEGFERYRRFSSAKMGNSYAGQSECRQLKKKILFGSGAAA